MQFLKLKSARAVTVLWLLMCFGARAQSNYYDTTLVNGLQVLIIEDHSLPIAHIEMTFRSGGFVETPDIDGLSHLYEHMVFNATAGYPTAKTFNDEILKYGILTNAGTDQEMVNYYFTLPSAHLETGMELFAQGILYPLFLKNEFENEKLIVNDEFQRYESDPFFHLDRMTDQKLWGEQFSRKNVIGDHEVILKAQLEQLDQLRSQYYRPDNALLILAGDVTKSQAAEMALQSFEKWNVDESVISNPAFADMGRSQQFMLLDENAEEPVILYAWQGPGSSNDLKGLFAITVFCEMLNLSGSDFQQELVETNLAYELEARATFSRFPGSVYITMYPNEKKIGKAIKVLETLLPMSSDSTLLNQHQLELAISSIKINEAYAQEELSEYIHELSYRWTSAGLLNPEEYLKGIGSVTLADIQQVVTDYLLGDRSKGIILTSKQARRVKQLGWSIENKKN